MKKRMIIEIDKIMNKYGYYYILDNKIYDKYNYKEYFKKNYEYEIKSCYVLDKKVKITDLDYYDSIIYNILEFKNIKYSNGKEQIKIEIEVDKLKLYTDEEYADVNIINLDRIKLK